MGNEIVPSAFAVTDFAAAAIAVAAAAISDLVDAAELNRSATSVDRTLSSAWVAASLRPQGWEPPPSFDSIFGDYKTSDGWMFTYQCSSSS